MAATNYLLCHLETAYLDAITEARVVDGRLLFSLVIPEGVSNVKVIKNNWWWTNLMVTYYNIVWLT